MRERDVQNRSDPTATNFPTASVNNAVPVPAANTYNVFKDSKTHDVTQAELDAGTPLIWEIGTREAGMFIGRVVFSSPVAGVPNPITTAGSTTVNVTTGTRFYRLKK